MLLLSILFTTVSLILCYALMSDTGRHTPHARRNQTDPKDVTSNRSIEVSKKESGVITVS